MQYNVLVWIPKVNSVHITVMYICSLNLTCNRYSSNISFSTCLLQIYKELFIVDMSSYFSLSQELCLGSINLHIWWQLFQKSFEKYYYFDTHVKLFCSQYVFNTKVKVHLHTDVVWWLKFLEIN